MALSVAGAGGVTLVVDVDPVRLDLAGPSAVALPRLSVTARLTGAGNTALLTPTGVGLARVGVAELRAGFALDEQRRPVLVVEAHGADVGATHFDVLDLSSPDALAAAAEQVVAGAAASLLEGLGTAAGPVGVILGLGLPDGSPLPAVDAARLLSDPLGAVAERWRQLIADPANVVTVLTALRDLVADTASRAVDVTGSGSDTDPWTVEVTSGLSLTARVADDTLTVGVQASVVAGDLGGAGFGARLEAGADVVALGLGGGAPRHASFLPRATGALTFAASSGSLSVGAPPTVLQADALGLSFSWAPGGAARVQPVARNARLLTGGEDLVLPVPTIAPDGTLALDEDGWVALETLIGVAAQSAAARSGRPWLVDAVSLLGWSTRAGAAVGGSRGSSGPRLSLAALVTDPAAELAAFAGALVDVASDITTLQSALDLLATLLSPSTGRYGGGDLRQPWRLPLMGSAIEAAADGVVALVAWLGPDGPDDAVSRDVAPLFGWQPGDPPLPSPTLVAALAGEAAHDDVLADLFAGRDDLVAGLEELVVRWTGTDGLVALDETSLPAGVTAHRLSDVDHHVLLTALDLAGVVGTAPATTVLVAVDEAVLPAAGDLPTDHQLDLTGAGRPPASFAPTLPADPTGRWSIRLGTRHDCSTTDDREGVDGQAARLAAALRPLAAAGPVVVVAHGGAGHPAVRARGGDRGGPPGRDHGRRDGRGGLVDVDRRHARPVAGRRCPAPARLAPAGTRRRRGRRRPLGRAAHPRPVAAARPARRPARRPAAAVDGHRSERRDRARMRRCARRSDRPAGDQRGGRDRSRRACVGTRRCGGRGHGRQPGADALRRAVAAPHADHARRADGRRHGRPRPDRHRRPGTGRHRPGGARAVLARCCRRVAARRPGRRPPTDRRTPARPAPPDRPRRAPARRRPGDRPDRPPRRVRPRRAPLALDRRRGARRAARRGRRRCPRSAPCSAAWSPG